MKKKDFDTDAYGRLSKNPNDSPEESYYRRRSYEKYFEGYTPYQAVKGDGKTAKTYREYTGPIYKQNYSSRQLTKRKVLYAVLSLTALSLNCGAQFINIPSNHSWYVSFAALIPLVCLVISAVYVCTYLFAGMDMKIREFREGATRLTRISLYAAIATAAPVLATLLMFVIQPGSFRMMDLLRFAMFALSALSIYILSRFSAGLKYTIIDGKNGNDPSSGTP